MKYFSNVFMVQAIQRQIQHTQEHRQLNKWEVWERNTVIFQASIITFLFLMCILAILYTMKHKKGKRNA